MSENGLATRNDGALINTLTGMGTDRSKAAFTQVGLSSANYHVQTELDQLAEAWPLNEICRALPEAATNKWCHVTLSKEKDGVIEAFNKYRDRIGARTSGGEDHIDHDLTSDAAIFSEAGFLANCYHGSAIVLNIDDGRPPWEPIDLGKIKTISGLVVLDSYQLEPDFAGVWNPIYATHYNMLTPLGTVGPEVLGKGFAQVAGFRSFKIHASRVIRFPGVRTTTNGRRFNRGWDGSLLGKVWDAYRRWESSQASVEELLADYSLFVYKMKGLSEMITEEGVEQDLGRRVESFRLMASVMKGLMIDAEEESVEWLTRSFNGIREITDSFRDTLIGASGIPHTVLFGESPSGLGATGESEQRTWAQQVATYQSTVVKPRLKRLYRLIWLAKDGPTKGKEPEGWDVTFPSIYEPTESEIISNRAAIAGADQSYKDMGVLAPEEIRQSRFGGPNWSYEVTLDDAAYKKAQEEAAAQQGGAPAEPEFPEDAPLDEEVGFEEEFEADLETVEQLDSDPLWEQAVTAGKKRFKLHNSAWFKSWVQQEYRRLCRGR